MISEMGECYSRCSNLQPSTPLPSHATLSRVLNFQLQKNRKEGSVFMYDCKACVSVKYMCVCVSVCGVFGYVVFACVGCRCVSSVKCKLMVHVPK